VAAPISYAVGGQQYVAIVVGWGGTYPLSAGEVAHKGSRQQNRSRVLAFRLGATASLPPVPPQEAPAQPPAAFGDPQKVAIGKAVYQGYCNVCHGDNAVGAGVLPDLRWSPLAASPGAWKSVVIDGSRAKAGMVSFGQVLTPDLAELVRAFVVARANATYAQTVAALSPVTSAAPAQ
jgi:alcohol dehydrogenase (cytochrome c)/quinohemoprotein ethanol dehydrogenase